MRGSYTMPLWNQAILTALLPWIQAILTMLLIHSKKNTCGLRGRIYYYGEYQPARVNQQILVVIVQLTLTAAQI